MTTEIPPTDPEPEELDLPAGDHLLDDVAEFVERHMAMAYAQIVAVTLWAAHTYVTQVFETTPRLAISSPQKGSGKTRLLELLLLLCFGARMSANMTPAYLFRVAANRPTFLIDEIDTIFRAGDSTHDDLRALINAGYRPGASVGRIEGTGNKLVARDFPVFAPVAVAGIGLPPDTVLDRSVLIRLRRRAPGEQVAPYRERTTGPEGRRLGALLGAWTASVADKLAVADPVMPSGLTDRPADIWSPLLAIADAAGGRWPDDARAAALDLNDERMDQDPDLALQLLDDLRDIMGSSTSSKDRWSSGELVGALQGRPEGPWRSFGGRDGIDQAGLARLLRPYDVRPSKMRIGALTTRGYRLADFADAWSRYLQPPLLSWEEPPPKGDPVYGAQPPAAEAADTQVSNPFEVGV